MNGPHQRTIQKALETVGSKERLASELEVTLAQLELFLAGSADLPHQAFLEALDIVANGHEG